MAVGVEREELLSKGAVQTSLGLLLRRRSDAHAGALPVQVACSLEPA